MKILVTGATSGIGRQLALDYQLLGNDVLAVGRNSKELDKLRNLGMRTLKADLLHPEEIQQGLKGNDRFDLVILAAGNCEYIDMPLFEAVKVARMMQVNVETAANTIEAVLPYLRRSDSPHLVGVGSAAAYLPLPRAEAYGASKAALAYLFDVLRISLAQEDITVSLVCPGFVKTPLTDKNDFPMPFLVSAEEASRTIRHGITRKRLEIHFPGPFTYLLKLLSILPRRLWIRMAQRMVRT